MSIELFGLENIPIVDGSSDISRIIKDAIENADYNSIEKFKRVDEGNVQLYVVHSKDKKFAAMQLLKYEPFDFVPQTEVKTAEF